VKANLGQRHAETSYGLPADELTPAVPWSAYGLRKTWNQVKTTVAPWWAENSKESVCLLEAGPSDVDDPAVLELDKWMALLESGYDWDYLVEPQESGNSFLRHARARVLGACSSHNSCIAFWAPSEDLDEWAAHGLPGWSAADIYLLYQRLETNDGPGDHRRRSGPGHDPLHSPTRPDRRRAAAACEQAGIPRTEFNSGKTITHGAKWFQINAREDGTRASASVSYLPPVIGKRPNLDIRTDMWAKKLIFDGRRCTGVEYLTDLFHSVQVKARREVVVSAGAIDTPETADVVRDRAGRTPSRGRGRRTRRPPRRRREPAGPPRGAGPVGRAPADGRGIHAVVGDRHLHHY
jgi:choline dehydrogenase-like flavoprotein